MKRNLPLTLEKTSEYKPDLEKQSNNNAAYLR
jgi:hypothetical protein